jgi:uncharacterized protein DUF4440/uncharacterized protein DUF1706
MAPKDELLRQAENEYDGFRAAVQGLDDGDMSRRWLGSWGVREIVAHIIGWHREMVPALQRLDRGEPPYADGAYDDFDRWNARFVEARRGPTAAGALLQELDASHREVLRTASKLPEELFAEGTAAPGLLNGVTTDHYREHAAQIHHWRRLRSLNARFIRNFVTNDTTSHDQITHRDFVSITATGAREDRAAYLARWATGFDPNVITYWDYRDELISLSGPVALVRAVTKYVIARKGTERTGMTMYTDTYIHENGEWTCVQAQLTPVAPEHYPPDDTIVQAYIRGQLQSSAP